MSYRKDPEWLRAQSEYVSTHPRLTPSEALVIRQAAAVRMCSIEMRYEVTL